MEQTLEAIHKLIHMEEEVKEQKHKLAVEVWRRKQVERQLEVMREHADELQGKMNKRS